MQKGKSMSKGKGIGKKIITVLSVLVVIVGLFVFMFSGENFDLLLSLFDGNMDTDNLQETLRGFGYKGVISLGLLSALQVVIPVMPSGPVQILSGVTYGLGWGILICAVGVLLGNTIIYILYKTLGEKVGEYFKKNIDVDLSNVKATNRLSLIVFVLFLVPGIPFGLICFLAASLGLKYPRYIIITTLGSLPTMILGVCLGNVATTSSIWVTIIALCVIVLLVILICIFRKHIFKWINKFINKQQDKATKKWMVRKPAWWAPPVARTVVRILRKKVNLQVKKEVEVVDGPAMVLCSHGSFMDFVYALSCLKKALPHFVIARLYFYRKLFNKALRAGGAFPKSMFAPDIENVKNCMTVINEKRILAMMPEAHLSTVGRFENIHTSTLKFIKKMGVTLYGIRIEGSYFAKPKWGDKIRKGAPVDAELVTILTAEQVKAMSIEEIYAKIKEAICYNDFEWLDKKHPDYEYNHDTLAEGLENILYRCPVCGEEFTIKTEKKDVFCTKCSYKATLNNRYGFIEDPKFKNYAEWYDYINEQLKQEILSNENYVLEDKVTLKMNVEGSKHLVDPVGEGVCRLNREGLVYEGTINGEMVKKDFPIRNMCMLMYGAGEDFEIYEKDTIYYFVPDELRSCVKWHVASLILKELSGTES